MGKFIKKSQKTLSIITSITTIFWSIGLVGLVPNVALARVTPPVTHTITASAGAHGSISPSGSVAVIHGSSQTFTITPSNHYQINTLTVDGHSTTIATSYTFNNVTTNHTIIATFTHITHTINASAGDGGTINPSGLVPVDDDDDQSFDIIPNAGYIISDLSVDGSSRGQIDRHNFNDISVDHAIAASFDGGWNAPSAYDDGGDFSRPDRAYTSNNNGGNGGYASATNGEEEIYKDFSFGIPAGATINGIAVSTEGYRSSSQSRSWDIYLSGDAGSSWTDSKNTGDLGTYHDKTIVTGGLADTWGKSWVDGELSNANFRIKLRANGNSNTNYLDQLQVKVSYTPDADAPAGYLVTVDQPYINNTNQNTLSFMFSDAEIGTIYNYSINDENPVTAAIEGSGLILSASQQIADVDVSSLSDGILTLTAYLVDLAGNQGADATATVTKDVVAPTLTLSASGVSDPTNISPIHVDAEFSEDVTGFDSVDVLLTNTSISDFVQIDNSHYEFNLTPISEGLVRIDVGTDAAQDAVMNSSQAAEPFSITYAFTAPSVTITDPSEDGFYFNTNNPYFSFITWPSQTSGQPIAAVDCALNDSQFIACDTTTSQTLYEVSDGSHHLYVMATDAAGNQSTADRQFFVDTTPPSLNSAQYIGNKQILVYFSEDLDDEALQIGDFAVSYQDVDYPIDNISELNGVVTLTLVDDLPTDATPTVMINPLMPQSIKDLVGNEQTAQTSVVAEDKALPILLSAEFTVQEGIQYIYVYFSEDLNTDLLSILNFSINDSTVDIVNLSTAGTQGHGSDIAILQIDNNTLLPTDATPTVLVNPIRPIRIFGPAGDGPTDVMPNMFIPPIMLSSIVDLAGNTQTAQRSVVAADKAVPQVVSVMATALTTLEIIWSEELQNNEVHSPAIDEFAVYSGDEGRQEMPIFDLSYINKKVTLILQNAIQSNYPPMLVVNPGFNSLIDLVDNQLTNTETFEVSDGIKPEAVISPAVSVGQVGQDITFDSSGSSDILSDIKSYGWNYGDDGSETLTESSAVHQYASDGIYNVDLVVTDNADNNSDAATAVVVIGSTEYQADSGLKVKFTTLPDGSYSLNALKETEPGVGTEGFLVGEVFYDITSTLSNGTFAVDLTFSYSDTDNDGVVDGTTIDENNLNVYYWDGDSWTAVADPTRDPVNNTITVNVDHFTLFGLLAVAPAGTAGGSTGGSGGGAPAGLTISNQAYLTGTDVINGQSKYSVTINWLTSHNSTSRVVYDTVSHPTLGGAPNYGYANSTIEDANLATYHTVVVSDLTPGTTYYYRAVSHGSPEVTSQEYSFTSQGEKLPTRTGEQQQSAEQDSQQETGGTETSGLIAGVSNIAENTGAETEGMVLGVSTEEDLDAARVMEMSK